MKKVFKFGLIPLSSLVLAGAAMADTSAGATAAVAAITSAQSDALAVAGGLVTMGVAVWGAMFLYRKFFR